MVSLKLPVMLCGIYMLDMLVPVPLVTSWTTLGAMLHDETLPLGAVSGMIRLLVCTVLVKAFATLLLVLDNWLYVALLIALLMTVPMLVHMPTCRMVRDLKLTMATVLHLFSSALESSIVRNTVNVWSMFELTPCSVLESIDLSSTHVFPPVALRGPYIAR